MEELFSLDGRESFREMLSSELDYNRRGRRRGRRGRRAYRRY